MTLLLVLLPALAGVASFFIRRRNAGRVLLTVTAVAHALFTLAAWLRPELRAATADLALDALGLLVLSVTSILFLAAAAATIAWLRREPSTQEPLVTGCMLLFLAAMTLVTVSRHFGLLWVGIEATTLASAPLIYFHRTARSLEATWKYLLICSVGIALAMLGNLFLAVSAGGHGAALSIEGLTAIAGTLDQTWLQAAFLLILVGYGTKMGLAPLHTWLPDAHSEAPATVSALLSGALLNCALLGILRALQVCTAAGLGAFAGELLTVFGLLSMALAAVFMIRQPEYKRLLAYSSVEHMGIIAVGIGIGSAGALLHIAAHSFTKGMLFLLAGNILYATKSRQVAEAKGILRRLPLTGALWLAGFLALTGTPPFGTFVSEFAIAQAAFGQGRYLVGGLYLALLALAFIALADIFLRMAYGRSEAAPQSEPRLAVLPALGLGVVVLLLGVWLPPGFAAILIAAARDLGGLL